MQSFLEHGFGVVFTSVSTEGMSADWVGRTLDGESLNELRISLRGIGSTWMERAESSRRL